ncbi:MAG: A24 family peptidase [Oceanicaulis sp.]|nr:A24 family peptidase [Oceanicaulis sp.]
MAILPIDLFLLAASPFVGSFITMAARAWPDWSRVLAARSACDGCDRVLTPGELIPVFSYAVQRGRCRCGAQAIWPLHPAGELLALCIAAACVMAASGTGAWLAALFGWALLLAALTDMRTLELPDVVTLGLIPVGLGAAFLREGLDAAVLAGIAAALGFASLGAIAWLYRRTRGREGLGMGDVKLLAAAGAWTAPLALPWIIAAAAAITLLGLAVARLAGTRVSADMVIPFGPGLALAAFVAHLVVTAQSGAWPGLIVWPS